VALLYAGVAEDVELPIFCPLVGKLVGPLISPFVAEPELVPGCRSADPFCAALPGCAAETTPLEAAEGELVGVEEAIAGSAKLCCGS
jgi:hypothetical protein